MSPAFEVVFFDLGDTLVFDKHPWEPLLNRADAALRASLEGAGYPLAPGAYGEFDTLFELYYHRRQDNTKEETTVQLLRELMTRQDDSPPEQVLRSAMEAMYAITQKNWYPEGDAVPTLKKLRERGYRLGLISNAADDENVQALVDKAGLRDYFELILSSAACGIRKPDKRIFHIALEGLKVPPERTAMVGDTLEADIQGANLIGMYSIWINRRAELPPDGPLEIQPQAVVSALSVLPDLLDDLTRKTV